MVSKNRRRELAALQNKRQRRKTGQFLAEGPVQVDTVLTVVAKRSDGEPAFRLRFLIAVDGAENDPAVAAVIERAMSIGIEVERLAAAEFAELTDTQTPQGIAAVVSRERESTVAEVLQSALPAGDAANRARLLILDGVQDPGNVGTLIRSAAAFGVGAVLLCKGCADATNPKAVRAAMGGFFALPILDRIDRAELAAALVHANVPVIVADIGGEPFASFAWPDACALALGAEVAGLSAELAALAGPAGVVGIPQLAAPQSVNVAMAGSILLAHLFSRG